MTSTPDRSRVRLPGISSRAYEHPADRSALVALRKLTGFDVILKNLAGLFNDRAFRLMFLASSVRASEEQFPSLYHDLLDGCYILDLPKVPELFISQDPMVQAMAVGMDKPFIVITSGMVDLMDEDEIRFVIGHELGHVLSGHSVYRTMLYALIALAARLAFIPFAWVGFKAVIWGLEEWFRKSELSCDRAGLLATQDERGGPAGADEDGGRLAAVRAEQRRVPPAGQASTTRSRTCGRACSSCSSSRARRTRSRWCASPSWTGGRTRASTATSWPGTTRAARTTRARRWATSSARRPSRTRTPGAAARTR